MGSSGGIRTPATYGGYPAGIQRGMVSRTGARSGELVVTDGTTTVDAFEVLVAGGTVTDQGGGIAQISFDAHVDNYENAAGLALDIGDVVVVNSSGQIVETTTAQDTRPVGIAQAPIAAGDTGPIAFSGFVSLVLVTASVTAGTYLETSTTGGQATTNATRRTGSFGYVITGGTSPTAILFGIPDTTASGSYEQTIEGGQDLINALGNVSGAVAVDPTLGNVATFTMTGTTTATISAPVGSGGSTLEWWVTQDGTGGRALTIAATAGSVTNTTSADTTAGVTVRYIIDRIPGTVNNWIVDLAGGAAFATPAIVLGTAAATGAAATIIRSDATIVAFDATAPTTSAIGDAAATGSAAKAARRDHVHGREALSTATPLVASGSGATGTGTKSSREDHVHPAADSTGIAFTVIGQETRVSDGSTTSYALDNDFEANSVQAFNLTSGKALVVTETLPNTVVIGAAGTSGDSLSFAYAASAI